MSSSSPSASPPSTPRAAPTAPGYEVVNEQYVDPSTNTVVTHTTFETTDPASDIQVTEDLSGTVVAYYDDTAESGKAAVIAQIQDYASKIQCSDFHGKGTIDDYSALFQAASRIANESKQMQLDVDIEGFNEFAAAADDLSALFGSFIVKLENISIIDDTAFLTAVANALHKIWNLSETFGRFKETILATSTIQLPKSAHDTKVLLEQVVGQVNCAMNYINHFVDSSQPASAAADLSPEEKDIINQAVNTIDNWNVLCEQGVSIAMSSNPDIQYMTTASNQFKTTAQTLKNTTNLLKIKLANYSLNGQP
jgi:hypothetical protein